MGLQARLMSQALRNLTAAAVRNGTCVAFINHHDLNKPTVIAPSRSAVSTLTTAGPRNRLR